MIAHDFPAEYFVEAVLQGRQLMGEFFQVSLVDGADFAVLEGKRIAGVLIGADGVQTEHLAGYVKPRDLFTTIDG